MQGTPVGSLLGKIPHAVRQLNLNPQLLSLCSRASSNYWSLCTCSLYPATGEATSPPPQLEGRPKSLQLEKARTQQQTLRAAQNKHFLKRNWTVSNTCLIRFISSCQKTHLDWHTISQSSQILSHVDERGTRWWGPWKLFYESIFVNFSTIFLRQQ